MRNFKRIFSPKISQISLFQDKKTVLWAFCLVFFFPVSVIVKQIFRGFLKNSEVLLSVHHYNQPNLFVAHFSVLAYFISPEIKKGGGGKPYLNFTL